MKIYNKIIYDINNNIIYEDSYEYNGPITKADAVGDAVGDILGSDIGQIALTIAVAYFAPTMVGALEGMGMSTLAARAIVAVGSSLVLGAVGKALAPKLDPPNFGTSLQQGITVTSKSPTQAYRIIYGQTRVGGTLVYADTTSDNDFLHLVIVLAGHEVDDISSVYFGDSLVDLETIANDSNGIPIWTPTSSDPYTGKATIKKHFGNADQVADATLVADVTQWTTNHRIRGKAYLYVKLSFDSDVYPNGVPNVSCIIKGKKCYDPRSTSFNANTDVSVANDTITLTTHGLSTFDRVKYDVNSGTAIGGLVDGTTYFVIKVDTNTIKLATNYANCLASTQINITSQPSSETQKFNFTTFTSNPALCVRDYLIDSHFGMKAGTDELHDDNFQSTANICDETVTLASPAGTENRFTCNGSFQISQSPKVIIENLLTTMGGWLVYSNGAFKLVPATYQTPTVTLNESQLRSGIQCNTRISKKELFNAVKGVYSEPANDYQPQNYPFLTNSTYETEDNSERIYGTFDYPFTSSSRTCQRLSKIQLLKARQQISFSATYNMEAFQLNIGDTINVTNERFGWTDKTFQLMDWNFQIDLGSGALVINAEFRETASAIYDYSTGDYSTVSSGKATNLPKATTVSPPSAIDLTDELVAYNDGTVIVKLVIDVTAATDNFTEIYEVDIKQTKDKSGNAVVDTYKNINRAARNKFEFLNVIDKASYQVRVRGVNIFGVFSSYLESSEYQVIGLTDPPANVENFACNILDQDAFLSWDPVGDLDLSYYELRYQNTSSGATWSASTPLVLKVSRPATSVVVPAKTGAYLIKARDKLGNPSVDATVVYTLVTTIGNFNAVASSQQDPDFSGVKTDVVRILKEDGTPALVLDTIELFDSGVGNFDSITDRNFDGGTVDSNVDASGTYDFDAPIDLGASYTSQLTGQIIQTVTSRDRLFDNISGMFDAQTGNFDGDAESNCSSELQIATSADGVTYTSFQTFVVGDYTARYYKFRVLMSSANNSATPIITGISVAIDMEDTIQSNDNITTLTTPYTVTFPRAFKTIPALGLAIQDMASGDTYDISSKSATGFIIAFSASGGGGVARTFDWIAKGY